MSRVLGPQYDRVYNHLPMLCSKDAVHDWDIVHRGVRGAQYAQDPGPSPVSAGVVAGELPLDVAKSPGKAC